MEKLMPGPPPVSGRYQVPSRLGDLTEAKRPLLEAAGKLGYPEEDLAAVNLALEEALTNAIRHGNREDPAKNVHVEFQVDGGEIRFSVQDEGNGFDVAGLADARSTPQKNKPSGRGVFLLRAYMDRVLYNDKGNRVTLVRRRRPGPAAPD
jgi:serine/threonine-protein kinase RsbW